MILQVTIADVLRHEGGMPVFSQQINIEDCFPENINNNNVAKIIEDEELSFPPGEYRCCYFLFNSSNAMLWRREYHAFSRGFILQEVFRRAEPDNKTLGQFLRENVFTKLGVGVHMGVSPELQQRNKIVDVEQLTPQQVSSYIYNYI